MLTHRQHLKQAPRVQSRRSDSARSATKSRREGSSNCATKIRRQSPGALRFIRLDQKNRRLRVRAGVGVAANDQAKLEAAAREEECVAAETEPLRQWRPTTLAI